MEIIDPREYDVYAYETGDLLDGTATVELIAASLAELSRPGKAGAVGAYLDDDEWYYVAPGQESLHTLRGETVVTVYVM